VPTYGYRCGDCGVEFDVWQRMSDEAKAACPACGSPGKRLFFPAGIVFKGSGFYKTDSRGKGATDAGNGASTVPSGGAPTSSESKGSGTAPSPSTPAASS
jgi:putative FmdB family regulatory protein